MQWDALHQLAVLCTQPLFEVHMMEHVHSGHSFLLRAYFLETARQKGLSVPLTRCLQLTRSLKTDPWLPEPKAWLECGGNILEQLHVDAVCAMDDLLAEGPLLEDAACFLLANAVVSSAGIAIQCAECMCHVTGHPAALPATKHT